jgi:hypothetical protein
VRLVRGDAVFKRQAFPDREFRAAAFLRIFSFLSSFGLVTLFFIRVEGFNTLYTLCVLYLWGG